MVDISQIDRASIGQYGVYRVAAELCGRGYIAVVTSRNAKGADILAFNPKTGNTAPIQVKTGRQGVRRNLQRCVFTVITIAPKELNALVFRIPFVFVFVPGDQQAIPRYFIVPGAKVVDMLRADWDLDLEKKQAKHSKLFDAVAAAEKEQRFALWVKDVEPYENKWENLGLGPV